MFFGNLQDFEHDVDDFQQFNWLMVDSIFQSVDL